MSTHSKTASSGSSRVGVGFVEFVVTIALLTAITAISIDIMLPVLPKIAADLNLASANDAQLVIGVFFLGFGISQIVFGSLSDTFGRRTVLLGGLLFLILSTFASVWASNLTTLLILRFAAGVGAAAVRITTIAMVRDCFGGREMARVMSYIMIIFMMIPLVAPFLGQLIDRYFNWHSIFIFIGVAGTLLYVWTLVRVRESMAVEERRPLSFASVTQAFGAVLTNRITCGYMIALTLFTAVICAYIVSVQQVFGEVYGMGEQLPLAFAGTSAGMALANFANGYFVRRFGMRRIAHSGILIFTVASLLIVVLGINTTPPFVVTYLAICVLLIVLGVVMTNFTAISLEPMGHLAGTATSVTGFVSTTFGAVLGSLVGQMFNGTIQPLFISFVLLGSFTILAVLWAERGKLFTHPGETTSINPADMHF
ncbi:multidrug effflux MFS transporter [Rhizobium sp. CFBP 8762]|uniref:multidrug effflux MFS transporter n=1 Tax=Rhizobium sp. CFBP 8762 TaxID=2775279 RepID=UPI001786D77C|nr:multidrug effflux MFS transporter [Rhizobium sp. CFBP 8762]MBD8554707.1 multidrug effflux MFS transporter [Rhizobium sp. CFBP 8762]